MSKIFISYRREDSEYAAQSINDALVLRFGKDSVFFDVDTIPPGVDFRNSLNDEVNRCDVLLAVIGDKWLHVQNEAGQRRLDRPDDFVRIEIEAALGRKIPLIPVLVGRANIPKEVQLPATMAPLVYQNAAELRPGRDFANHLERLVWDVERALAETPLKDMNFHASAAASGRQLRRNIENEASPPSHSSAMPSSLKQLGTKGATQTEQPPQPQDNRPGKPTQAKPRKLRPKSHPDAPGLDGQAIEIFMLACEEGEPIFIGKCDGGHEVLVGDQSFGDTRESVRQLVVVGFVEQTGPYTYSPNLLGRQIYEKLIRGLVL